MLMYWLGLGLGMAQDCPPTAESATNAWALFDDVEIDQAKQQLDQAVDQLACQSEAVSADDLARLYRLDTLIALNREDPKAAQFAAIRAVTMDPERLPPEKDGPEIYALYRTWSARLASVTLRFTPDVESPVRVDGVPVTEQITLLAGTHLIQVETETPGQFVSTVVDLTHDVRWTSEGPIVVPREQPVVVVESSTPEPAPVAETKRRRRPWWLLGPGVALTAAGGAGIGYTAYREQQFGASSFSAASYGGCSVEEACYRTEREAVIAAEASQIRLMYGGAYGMTAVGAGFLVAGVIGIPVTVTDRTVTIYGRF